MTIPRPQLAYAPASGTTTIPTFRFEARDPTPYDTAPQFVLYSAWVNTITKGIWYLEAFLCSNAVVTSQWRAVAPIVVAAVAPASPLTASADYAYPIGQTWVNSTLNDYFVMVSNPTATTGYWIKLSAGTQGVDLLQGNTGGAVGPDASGIINVVGDGTTITIAGNPGTSTLTASLIGGSPAIEKINMQTGTTPVVPTAGAITFNGAVVTAGTNPVRTDGTGANTMALEVQISQALAAADATKIGLSNFNSAQFSVTAAGFVSLVSASSGIVAMQVFPANGTYTPTSGMDYCWVRIIGGGGAGGGCSATSVGLYSMGGGGASGEYAEGLFSAAQIGASKAVTIGAGGVGALGATGGSGGTSSLGALITAMGGSGGLNPGAAVTGVSNAVAGGTGGAGGNFRTPGYSTQSNFSIAATAVGFTGSGANSQFGEGGLGFFPNGSFNGNAALGYGAGGGGAGSSAITGSDYAGGNGSGGIVVIMEFI